MPRTQAIRPRATSRVQKQANSLVCFPRFLEVSAQAVARGARERQQDHQHTPAARQALCCVAKLRGRRADPRVLGSPAARAGRVHARRAEATRAGVPLGTLQAAAIIPARRVRAEATPST
eukprot:4931406-Prymnesium_polylepis.2